MSAAKTSPKFVPVYDYDFDITPDEMDENFNMPLYKVMIYIMCYLITLIGVVGNIMVIIVIVRRKRICNTINIALLNLAVCDLLFVAICVPFLAYHYTGDSWMLGEAFCKFFMYLWHVTVYMTVYILVFVSILRYLTVVHGIVTAKYRSNRNITLCLILLWAVILITNCPLILVYQTKTFRNNTEPESYKCSVISKDVGKQLFLSLFVMSYFVPLAIIATFYTAILRYLKQEQNRMRNTHPSHTPTVSRFSIEENTLRATRIIIIIVLVFGLCWLPLHVHILVVSFGGRPKSLAYIVFQFIAHFLAYANACLNPMIYNFASDDFRKEFRRLCGFPWRKVHVTVSNRPVVETVETIHP